MSSLTDFSKIENDDAPRYSIELGQITSEPVLANRFKAKCCSPPALHPLLFPSLNSICQMWSFQVQGICEVLTSTKAFDAVM